LQLCGTSTVKRLVSRIFKQTIPSHLACKHQLLAYKLYQVVYHLHITSRKSSAEHDFVEECEASCVCWTSALVERKWTTTASFPRLLHIAAHLPVFTSNLLHQNAVLASAQTHCTTVLSTVRYGKCNVISFWFCNIIFSWTFQLMWSESQSSSGTQVALSVPFPPVLTSTTQ